MNNIKKIAEDILKVSVNISEVDPKIQNRIKEVKKIYQQISVIENTIREQVEDLQNQVKQLQKQAQIFEKQLIPVLKELQDHAIEAEGVFIQLKKGRRSPKVGYEYLADKVSSELLMAAEEVITDAAEFAKGLTISVSSTDGLEKTAGKFTDWLKNQWNKLVSFVNKLKSRSNSVKKSINELKRAT